jgi:hypothetical protein
VSHLVCWEDSAGTQVRFWWSACWCCAVVFLDDSSLVEPLCSCLCGGAGTVLHMQRRISHGSLLPLCVCVLVCILCVFLHSIKCLSCGMSCCFPESLSCGMS